MFGGVCMLRIPLVWQLPLIDYSTMSSSRPPAALDVQHLRAGKRGSIPNVYYLYRFPIRSGMTVGVSQ